MAEKKKKLGRGLNALLGESNEDYAKLDKVRTAKPVAVEMLHPGKYQPRHHVDQEAIDALAQSIREKGVLQPLLVRRHPDDAQAFEIIAGERRWRAAQLAQLAEVPVIIKDFDDKTTLEVALVENVQRENLSAVEEADAFQRLMDEFGHTQEDVSRLVGKSRSHVANTLRLLALEDKVKKLVEEGLLSAGHARTLIGVDGAYEKAKKIIEKNLSVREAERLAKQSGKPGAGKKSTTAKPKDVDTLALERDLSNLLGLKVSVEGSGPKGELRIAYENLDQLDFVIDRLKSDASSGPLADNAAPAADKAAPKDAAAPAPKLSVSLKPKTARAK
ncbi:MAG: ParB/RepB/Spo0J family partition protein [Rhodospirillales bacterium]|nr:ParB/RepB/Spo0J family partition protein [Rhodospirillales bacterium]MBO6787640.1 ParB/RepB/Spo0J family partition protein [Rhodospirillales bacterium]